MLLFPFPAYVLTGKKINVAGDKAGRAGFPLQPLPAPRALSVASLWNGNSLFGHFHSNLPEEQFHQRVTLLSRPYKPIKSSLAGISMLQSHNRKDCLQSWRTCSTECSLRKPAPGTHAWALHHLARHPPRSSAYWPLTQPCLSSYFTPSSLSGI